MAKPTDSILLTVKKMLGIAEEYHAFDIDLIVNINSVFLTLNQLGVGPEQPYRIEGPEEVWKDFLGEQFQNIAGVETYVYLKTRLLFDPPTNSFLVTAIENQCSELEWRLNVKVDYDKNPIKEEGEDNRDVYDGPFGSNWSEYYHLLAIRERDADRLKAAWDKGSEMGNSSLPE